MTKHLTESKQMVPGTSAPAALANRAQVLTSAIETGSSGAKPASTFVDVLDRGLKNQSAKKDLQVQLNTVEGLTSKKNTAVQKLRLRRLKDKRGK